MIGADGEWQGKPMPNNGHGVAVYVIIIKLESKLHSVTDVSFA